MYSVRELGKDDATVWRALRVRGAELYPEAFLPTAEEARSVSIEQDQAGLAQGGRFALFHDAEAVGIAAIRLMYFSRTRHRATIGPFFIVPEEHGSGAAAKLLVALEEAAKRRGVWQMELFAAASNTRAIRFYQGQGFQCVGRSPNALLGPDGPADDLFYVKDLRKPN